jgi:hypothetical protein
MVRLAEGPQARGFAQPVDEGTRLGGPQEIAAAIQQRAFEVVPYIPAGQWKTRTAYRKSLKDLVLGPVIFRWGVEKA